MRLAVALTTFVALTSIPAIAQNQNLLPQSQQEFQRVYGAGAPPAGITPSPNAVLRPETVQEFRRVFGTNVLSGTAQLQSMTTPATVDSVLLNAVLDSSDPRRFYILWHLISVDVTAIDHRAILTSSPGTFHQQFGPARSARALALIHQAMFEAVNVVQRKYASTLQGLPDLPVAGASQDAAIIEAAYQTIVWLYPGLNDQVVNPTDPANVCVGNKFSLSAYYSCSLDKITDAAAKEAGIAIARAVVGKIKADRSHDGAERPEPVWNVNFTPRRPDTMAADYPFAQWQIDPVSKLTTALGGAWPDVAPFAMTSGLQFRPVRSPSALIPNTGPGNTPNYAALPSYKAIETFGREVRLDASGKPNQPGMTDDGIFVAQFWAYDGTINLCAPARLYNQIAAAVLWQIEEHPNDGYADAINVKETIDVARFYALVNIAMADASIAAWDAKFFFQFPRPVTYIRAVQEKASSVPNASKWFPLGAQNTNSDQPYNITPPFPSYPSGHAVFGGALFGTLRQFMKPTATFAFLSDEFNGKNKDVYNYIRCSNDGLTKTKFCQPRTFSLNCAERENADSRLFMGVHWVFDADDGIEMGNRVAKQVFQTKMTPLKGVATSRLFSVEAVNFKTRASLKCGNIDYPAKWDDPVVGFGPLKIVEVN